MTYNRLSSEHLAFDATDRLRRINELRRLWGLEEKDYAMSSGTEQKTVGIEIEMTWPQAFPDMAEWRQSDVRPRDLPRDSDAYARFSADYDRNDQYLRPKLEQLKPLIPRVGRDAYWEFSFRPTQDPAALMGEVDLLYDEGILHRGIEYATHLTLAGPYSSRDAHAILYLLEQQGGSTVDRLTRTTGWSCKGVGGFRRRSSHELVGSDRSAIEFRSLVALGPEQIASMVRLAQTLGAIITEDPERWEQIRTQVISELRELELPLREWGRPSVEPGLWEKYAGNLGKSAIRIS